MRLTVYSDYALRLLMFLAVKGDELATIADVAKSYRISKNHLMKVAYELGTAGYIETVRGRGGGLRLARPAASIGLGDIVRYTERNMALVPCFRPDNADCAILRACVLRGALARAADAFLAVLDGYSLADLARPRAPLRSLLHIVAGRDTRAAKRA